MSAQHPSASAGAESMSRPDASGAEGRGLALIEKPAAEGSRRVALAILDEAYTAAQRVESNGDAEALHDLRVAIRRLRTILRAYQEVLNDTVQPRWRRRLGKLARATNSARDAEVQLAWLQARAKAGDIEPDPSFQRLAEHLEQTKENGYRSAREHTVQRFRRIAAELRPRLSSYTLRVPLDGVPTVTRSFGDLSADAINQAVSRLWSLLQQVEGPHDESGIHQARIAAKRVRYILEPLLHQHPAVKPLLKWLKSLQTELGELHDAQLLGSLVRGLHAPVQSVTAPTEAAEHGTPVEHLLRAGERAHFESFTRLMSEAHRVLLPEVQELVTALRADGPAP